MTHCVCFSSLTKLLCEHESGCVRSVSKPNGTEVHHHDVLPFVVLLVFLSALGAQQQLRSWSCSRYGILSALRHSVWDFMLLHRIGSANIVMGSEFPDEVVLDS